MASDKIYPTQSKIWPVTLQCNIYTHNISVCDKLGLWELVNLLWLRNVNKKGMTALGIKFDRNVWKKTFVARIQEYGMRQWRNGFGINEKE